jgi:hypothetical protein
LFRVSFRTGIFGVLTALVGISLGCGDETRDAGGDAAEAEVAAATAEPDDGRGLVVRGSGVTDGYVLYAPLLSKSTYLVDNDGLVVHEWRSDFVASSPYLRDDGSLIADRKNRPRFRRTSQYGCYGNAPHECPATGASRPHWRSASTIARVVWLPEPEAGLDPLIQSIVD